MHFFPAHQFFIYDDEEYQEKRFWGLKKEDWESPQFLNLDAVL